MTQPELAQAWDSAFAKARERLRVRDEVRAIRMRRTAKDNPPKLLTFSDALETALERKGR